MDNISIECQNGNYHCVSINDKDYYFSYKTLVAFRTPKGGLICHKNDWGTTTGKHLNKTQYDHSKRVDSATFEKMKEKYL